MVDLTPEQQDAVTIAVDTLDGSAATNRLSIGGLAGTGKTTIVRSILAAAKPHIAVAAFTGKAANVLRTKGVGGAQTLHSLIYKIRLGSDGKPIRTSKGQIIFDRLKFLEADGVIIDEASMLNTSLYNDLLSYGVPVVFIGDHGQLEPIGDNPGVMVDPDLKLEHIHRQAEGSSILTFAHAVREGRSFDWKTSNGDVDRIHLRSEAIAVAHTYDMVICAKNKTRFAINDAIRKAKGFREDLHIGESIICLRNDRGLGVFNGMILKVDNIARGKFGEIDTVDFISDDGLPMPEIRVAFCREKDAANDVPLGTMAIDYAYCLTAHKAQGSEFPRILVIEEPNMGRLWNPRRWAYTAATRASKHLTWCGPR